MSRTRLFGNALRFALLTGVATAAACSDDPGGGGGDGDAGASGDGPSTGAQPSGGTSGMGTGGSNAGGEPGEGGTTTGGSAGTASGTGGGAGEGGDAGDGGEGANGGTGGAAGSSAGMAGGGAGGTGGGMAGAGMAGGGTAGSGMAGSGNVAGGGAAGSGAAGGTGGSGTVGCGSPNILDDMEDGDGGVCWFSTRQGGWYVGKEDGVGVILPDAGTVVNPSLLVPVRGTSTRAMHFQGSGFAGASHFAFLAVAVNAGTEGVPYDASVHTGIRFWAKSDAGGLVLNVKFGTVSTTDAGFGGSCVPTTVPCGDHWQVPRTLTGAWQQYSVYFPSDLSQQGWGVPRPKDLAHLRGIEFFYISNGNPAAFDFWIDDVEFW